MEGLFCVGESMSEVGVYLCCREYRSGIRRVCLRVLVLLVWKSVVLYSYSMGLVPQYAGLPRVLELCEPVGGRSLLVFHGSPRLTLPYHPVVPPRVSIWSVSRMLYSSADLLYYSDCRECSVL